MEQKREEEKEEENLYTIVGPLASQRQKMPLSFAIKFELSHARREKARGKKKKNNCRYL